MNSNLQFVKEVIFCTELKISGNPNQRWSHIIQTISTKKSKKRLLAARNKYKSKIHIKYPSHKDVKPVGIPMFRSKWYWKLFIFCLTSATPWLATGFCITESGWNIAYIFVTETNLTKWRWKTRNFEYIVYFPKNLENVRFP